MMIIKLAAVAIVLFALFGGALLFVQLRRKKIKKSDCCDEGEHGCSHCSCERL